MTSHLLASDGSTLTDEAGNELVWDATTGTAAITSTSTLAGAGNRITINVALAIVANAILQAVGAPIWRGAAPTPPASWTEANTPPSIWTRRTTPASTWTKQP
jgi:hypothetical protein